MLGVKEGRSDRFMLLPPDWEDWKGEDTHIYKKLNKVKFYHF